tara:strand:+ start:422 stop:721 length:300 start_codon:yes stop_codon:yes gene_type:complete
MIYDFQPGDGTRYNLVTVDDPHGGVLVICNNSSVWRYHAGDVLKFLCGNENEYTRVAIWNHLEAEDKFLRHEEDIQREIMHDGCICVGDEHNLFCQSCF